MRVNNISESPHKYRQFGWVYTVHLGGAITLTVINVFISAAEWLPYMWSFQTVLIRPPSCLLEMSGHKAKSFLHNSPQTPRRNQETVAECFMGRAAACAPVRGKASVRVNTGLSTKQFSG